MNLPDVTGDLAAVLSDIWQRLTCGKVDRRSPLHTPIISSVCSDGGPEQRVMVLRHFDSDTRFLRFHTDARSTKADEFDKNSQVSVLFYDPSAKIQIRVKGRATIASGDAAQDAWLASTPFARRCYMTEAAPGSESDGPTSGLPDWIEAQLPTEDQLVGYEKNFAALRIVFDRIDWLYLSNSGHRRAQFAWNGESWVGRWVVP